MVVVAVLASAGCSNPEAARYCEANLTACGGGCFDLESDTDNCGACGNLCGAGQACSGGQCYDFCNFIAGPGLTTNISGWPDSGIQFTPMRDTILTSFTFANQGAADTVYLVEAGTTVQTLSTPAGDPAFSPSVFWPLQAGVTYQLLNVDGSNGRWVSYAAFPTTNGTLRVDGTWGSGTLQPSFWFTFLDLASCP